MRKLLRITTSDVSLYYHLKGQLAFLSGYYEVIAVSSDSGRLAEIGKREGVRTVSVPMHREISIFSDIKCLWLLWKLFVKEKPFIVHANTPKASFLSMAAGFFAGVPNRVYTVTGLRYTGAEGALRRLLMTMEKLTCMFSTKVIPEGVGVQNILENDNITGKPLRVILNGNINGIDTDWYSPESIGLSKEQVRGRLGIDGDAFTFVYVGRIVRDKGMNELYEAMSSIKKDYPKCRLILVGDFEENLDPVEKSCENFFRSDPSVCFAGFQDDPRPYYAAADALVFPSYREGFPNVVMQAGAMGLPSIVTDISGCNEIIVDGENGRIIPPKDASALEGMMRWFLEHPVEVEDMASKSREMISLRYEQKSLWNAILKMYRGFEN